MQGRPTSDDHLNRQARETGQLTENRSNTNRPVDIEACGVYHRSDQEPRHPLEARGMSLRWEHPKLDGWSKGLFRNLQVPLR